MRPGPLPLHYIVKIATLVAVMEVEKIEAVDGIRIAHALVRRPFKGGLPGQRFTFIAEPTWTCDSSTAIAGESALLFLSPAERKGLFHGRGRSKEEQYARALQGRLGSMTLYQIVSNGGGRMPIRVWGGREYIMRHWTAVLPPKVSLTRDPTVPKQDVRYSPLDEVIPYIRKYLVQQANINTGRTR